MQRITLATNIYGEMCWCFNLEDLYFFLWLSQYFNLLKYFIKNLMLYVLLTPRSECHLHHGWQTPQAKIEKRGLPGCWKTLFKIFFVSLYFSHFRVSLHHSPISFVGLVFAYKKKYPVYEVTIWSFNMFILAIPTNKLT